MKVEEIERLLAKFYEGTTTESQEEALRDYFRTTEVPEHLLKDKEIFLNLYLNADHDVEIPAYLEDKLNLLIDEMAEKEQRFQEQLALDWKYSSHYTITCRSWIWYRQSG